MGKSRIFLFALNLCFTILSSNVIDLETFLQTQNFTGLFIFRNISESLSLKNNITQSKDLFLKNENAFKKIDFIFESQNSFILITNNANVSFVNFNFIIKNNNDYPLKMHNGGTLFLDVKIINSFSQFNK